MSLSAGDRLGAFEVTGELGAGGMGIVLRARDTKLDRDVALKVLPDLFANDPERLGRFQREAKVLASLNHPNIGSIYGIEDDEADGVIALVLELIEGPTLADRIAQGPISIEAALPIARQIAEALEAAHEQGIVHRDLKPANVKVKPDGTVKVLDFGLAKAFQPEASDPGVSASPTLSLTAAATQMGMVIGTAAYMAPEQAKGAAVDKRADVWAFGCVLFEMLTGRRVFDARDVSEVLASVLLKDPDLASLPTDVPPRVRSVLARCLVKESKNRLRDVGEARVVLREAESAPAASEPTAAPVPKHNAPVVPSSHLQVWQRPVPAALVALVLVAVTGVVVWSLTRPDVVPATVVRFVIPPADTAPFDFEGLYADLAITADGTQIVYRARSPGGGSQLHLRPVGQLLGAPLRGGEDGAHPFVSRDGEWVGFVDGVSSRALRKVSILGGPPVTLTEIQDFIAGASWGPDDQIIFGTVTGGLYQVPEGGGEPEVLTTLDAAHGETGHFWPAVIPGRRAVLFVTSMSAAPLTNPQLAVLALDTGVVTRLGIDGVSPRYVSTGHIVYGVMEGSVRAVPFDADSLEVTGTPVPLVESVMVKTTGAANFGVSDQGSLVYVDGGPSSDDRTVAFVARDGAVNALELPRAPYLSPRVSPDGESLVVQTAEDEGGVLWIYDLFGDTQIQQLTFEGDSQRPVWTPDSRRITFSSDRDGTMSLYEVPADGSGVPERLTTAEEGTFHWPTSWSPDGQTLLFNVQNGTSGADWDIWTLSASGRETHSLHATPDTSSYVGAELSPNGEWLAYGEGPVAGSADIYVEPFPLPPTGAKRRISQNGGIWPLWSADGDRLLYRLPLVGVGVGEDTSQLRSVDIITEPGLSFTNEQTLPVEGFVVTGFYRDYDITPDGEQLVMVFPADQTQDGESSPSHINVVLNWFEELKARVPVP